jgi:hypothetical protein
VKRFLALAVALTIALPAVAGPISLNPANWFWVGSTKGGAWNPPGGPRSGLSPDVRGFGQHGRGVNSNDSVLMGTRITPTERHGEFQSVSLGIKDPVDQGAMHVYIRGEDGRSLIAADLQNPDTGAFDMARVGPSANGARSDFTLPLEGVKTGEKLAIDILVDDFINPGGNGYTLLYGYAIQNCEVLGTQRVQFVGRHKETISQPPIPKPNNKPKRDRKHLDDKKLHKAEGRHESRQDRKERRENRKGK